MKKRYTIALFIGHMENRFSEEVFLGAAHTAEQLDINLVVFPVRYIETIKHDLIRQKYQYQYNCMFSYAEKNSFDAIIVETAVISKYVTHDTISAILKKFAGTPIVTISEKIDNYPCISFEANGIEQEIDHLVNFHNKKRIGYLSGPSSNLEAVQRFEEYKKALEKNNISFDSNLVAEGDFTEESSTSAICHLLDKNENKLDAICFANDNMAVAGYKELARRGIEIGKDIVVTGFDDIPGSVSMDPPLTTIRASYRELGENAVSVILELLNGVEISDRKISTSLIKRDSCGCKSKSTMERESLDSLTYEDPSIHPFVHKIHDILFSYYNNTNIHPNKRIINLFLRFVYIVLLQAENPEEKIDKNLIIFKFNILLNYNILDFITVENLNFLLSAVCDKAVAVASSDTKKEEIFRIFMDFFKQIVIFKQKENQMSSDDIKKNIHTVNSIIGNVIENYEINCHNPLDVMRTFNNIRIRSSYLYIHENPVITHSRYDWVQPEYEILNSYNIDEKTHCFYKGKKVKAKYLFKNDYLPSERFTFIASPLFCSEENYGLLLCNVDADDYIFYNSIITSQISYSIKLRNMLIEHRQIQSNLIESLNRVKTNNIILSQISKSDELTGVYNRRGFVEKVISMIRRNAGKQAVIIYADMDNLKQINDIFGHDEGDNAIKKASEILKECVRVNDITARFGGDEFAAFAITHENDFCELFMDRLEKACASLNSNSDKPYNIHISAGLYRFVCSKNIDLTNIMNEADAKLYLRKKLKSNNILKNPEDIHKYRP